MCYQRSISCRESWACRTSYYVSASWKNSKILGYSMERRLRPRVELCKEMGLPAERMLFSFHSKKPEDFEAACMRAKREAEGQ